MGVLDVVKPGVLTGSEAKKLFAYAKENNFAIPAVNVVGTDSVNAVLEVAAKVNSPIIIQFSNGGAGFYAGKGLKIKAWMKPLFCYFVPVGILFIYIYGMFTFPWH